MMPQVACSPMSRCGADALRNFAVHLRAGSARETGPSAERVAGQSSRSREQQLSRAPAVSTTGPGWQPTSGCGPSFGLAAHSWLWDLFGLAALRADSPMQVVRPLHILLDDARARRERILFGNSSVHVLPHRAPSRGSNWGGSAPEAVST